MNDVILTYRPYRSLTLATYSGVVTEIAFLLFLGGLLFNPQQFSIQAFMCFLFFIVLDAFLIKISFDGRKITIYFTQEGMHLINDGKTAWRFITWENFTHVYYQSGSKCTYLVLSSEELDKNQLKRITRRINLGAGITAHNAVIIPLDLLQDKSTAKIREIVNEKVNAVCFGKK